MSFGSKRVRAWLAFGALTAAVLGGCASTPEAARERDTEAKQFISHPDAATLYVYRSPFNRAREDSVLYVDGRLIGTTLPGAYFRINVNPGRHTLHGLGVDAGTTTLDTRPGEIYFVSLNVVAGQSVYELVRPDAAQRQIGWCCALLENWAPGQRPLLR